MYIHAHRSDISDVYGPYQVSTVPIIVLAVIAMCAVYERGLVVVDVMLTLRNHRMRNNVVEVQNNVFNINPKVKHLYDLRLTLP